MRSKKGFTPVTSSTTASLYFYLGTRFEISGRLYGPYMTFKSEYLEDNTDNYNDENGVSQDLYKIMDPWGKEYVYVRAGEYTSSNAGSSNGASSGCYNRYSYQIYSKGPDGVTGGNYQKGKGADDINNW